MKSLGIKFKKTREPNTNMFTDSAIRPSIQTYKILVWNVGKMLASAQTNDCLFDLQKLVSDNSADIIMINEFDCMSNNYDAKKQQLELAFPDIKIQINNKTVTQTSRTSDTKEQVKVQVHEQVILLRTSKFQEVEPEFKHAYLSTIDKQYS